MVKIPITELRNFLSKANEISTHPHIPQLAFIKLECDGDTTTLTKTNLETFLVFTVDGAKATKNFSLLLDQKSLSAAASESSAKELKISFTEKKHDTAPSGKVRMVKLEDGDLIDTDFQSEDEKQFPVISQYDKKTATSFDAAMIEAITMSAACCTPKKEIPTWDQYVHIKKYAGGDKDKDKKKKSYITGNGRQVMYFKTFDKSLPTISLDLNSCKIIRKYSEATGDEIKKYHDLTHYTGGNYNFFSAGKTLFGFSKSEVMSPEFTDIVGLMDTSKWFVINRVDLIRFCNLAIKINPMSVIEPCFLVDGEKGIILDYDSKTTSKRCKNSVEVKKNKKFTIPEFLFSPKEMMTVLGGLSFEKIKMVGPSNGNYFIQSDEDSDYLGAIRMVLINNEQKTVADANSQ